MAKYEFLFADWPEPREPIVECGIHGLIATGGYGWAGANEALAELEEKGTIVRTLTYPMSRPRRVQIWIVQ
jgi:hypothetical protein